jgi:hypothetical protein
MKSLLFDLPEDLIHCICSRWIDTVELSSLEVAAGPSHRFGPVLRALLEDSCFTTPGLSIPDFFDDDYFHWLTTRNLHMESLSLSNSSSLALFPFIQFLHLRIFSIENLSLSAHPDFLHLFFHLPHLTSLTLLSCYDVRLAMTRTDLPISTTIQHFNVSGSVDFTDGDLAVLLSHLPQLCVVDLSNCGSFSDNIVDQLVHHVRLVALSIAGVEQVSNAAVARLLHKIPRLTSLDLSRITTLTDAMLLSLSAHFQLRHLRLAELATLSDDCVGNLLPSLHGLEVLDVTHIPLSERTFLTLANSCHHLRELNVSFCTHFENSALIRLVEHCEFLEHLDFSFCHRITDAGILSVANCCKHIQSLMLTSCGLLTDFSIEVLSARCTGVRKLSIAGLDQLTDTSIIVLAANLTLLEELDISSCSSITDASVLAVLLACQRLRRLSATDNARVTSCFVDRLIAPSTSHMRLRFLDLSFCHQVELKSVVQLRVKFPKLTVQFHCS